MMGLNPTEFHTVGSGMGHNGVPWSGSG